jgi:hypothetical protein
MEKCERPPLHLRGNPTAAAIPVRVCQEPSPQTSSPSRQRKGNHSTCNNNFIAIHNQHKSKLQVDIKIICFRNYFDK